MKRITLALLIALSTSVHAGQYDKFVSQAKEALTKDFNDPESVKYRNLGVYRGGKYDHLYLCGEFNTKNLHGAYIGYVKFYGNTEWSHKNIDGIPGVFENVYPDMCKTKQASVK